jgi:amino acid adenylation domain-containing protein
MAQDAGLALLVSESTLCSVLPWPRGPGVLLDADARAIVAQSDAPLAPDAALDARPEDAGYVIYTSGSTGKPKGVVVPHRAVVNFLTSMAREPGLRAADVLVAVTTLSFDIAVLELLLPLSVGARVVLASREQALDGSALRQLLESSRASVMQATPSTWRILVEAGWQGPPGFKALVGGEGLPIDLAQQLLDCLGSDGELWNLYGPTETTVWSSRWRVRQPEHGIRIGRPIANTQVHILDECQQPCPIGVPGEICIGGEGVALGYLHRPELTAERFIADPSGQDPRTRLYRTGDRGRWRRDGLLEHLGRLDHQVKLRGHRIELGEVEATLASHPEVARAVAVVREDRPGDARLVAYVVARDVQPAAAELIEHLRHTLPDYMLPQHVVPLQTIPLLPNGKIDRKALPAPDLTTRREAVEPAGSPIEEGLLRIWCEQLGTNTIGVYDNFFELGGHSLLAAHLVYRINGELQVPCTLPMLFRAPTIRGLAQEIAKGHPTHGAELVALQPKGSGPALFCICGVHLYQALADHLGPNVPVYGIFLPYEQALTERAAPGHARLPSVEEMAADYVKTMRAQQPSGPYCLAGVSFGGVLAYEMAQQLTRSGEQVRFLAMLDTVLPGAITRDWLRWTFDQLRQVRQQGSRVLAEKLRRRLRRGHDNSPAATKPRPNSIEDELQHIVVARRAIYKQATRAYAVQPYAGLAILVRAQVGHWPSSDIPDPSYRWSQFAQDLQIYDVPGDHLGILKPPNVHTLARHLLPHIESGRLHRPAERGAHVAP